MVILSPVENFEEFYKEHEDFINDKYSEASVSCASTRDIDLDFALFQTLIDNESTFVFEIFMDETFVGYTSMTVCPALLNKGKVDAFIDHIALDKDSRGKGVAKEVIKNIEDFLKIQGVDEIKLMIPATENHDAFADKLGYSKALTTHIKRL